MKLFCEGIDFFVIGCEIRFVVKILILQSRYMGIVSVSWDIMFGGVIIVVMMNVLMIKYECYVFSFLMVIMLSFIIMMSVIGILKVSLKVRNMVIIKDRQVLILGVGVMFFGVKLLMK